jgi:starch-binding outer membrane protein, SusD/RagB family
MKNIHSLNKITSKEMKAFLIPALFLGFILTFTSCQEDFLELTPKDSYTEATVFDDPVLTESFLNYGYRMILHGFAEVNSILPLAAACDEAHAKGQVASYGPILLGNQSPSYLFVLDEWTGRGNSRNSRNYKNYWIPIKQCNEFLEKIATSEIEELMIIRMTGEAKAIRAYSYFKLICNYGGVPLITKPFTLDDDFKIPRNTYDEVIDFVLTELDAAIDMLPLEYADNSYAGRVTKGAVMAIKARALLFYASPLNNPSNDLPRWQRAAEAAKDVIDLGKYGLYPDYKELFTVKGGYNEEVIWARPFDHILRREVYLERRLYPNGSMGHGHIPPIQNLVDDYEMNNGMKINEPGSGYDPQNPYVDRDPRFYATILYDGAPFLDRTLETFIPGGLDSFESTISSWNASETGYNLRKFITDEYEVDIGSGNTNALWPWFRYGEVLLNYAEANYFLGNEGICREYINMIRSRTSVNMPPVTESGQDLFDRLVNERRIELAFEEHRFFDVRRWKIATTVLSVSHKRMYITKDTVTGVKTYEVKEHLPAHFNEWNYLSPIPLEEIEKNSLLGQNPGY